jgi:hypothetical protein
VILRDVAHWREAVVRGDMLAKLARSSLMGQGAHPAIWIRGVVNDRHSARLAFRGKKGIALEMHGELASFRKSECHLIFCCRIAGMSTRTLEAKPEDRPNKRAAYRHQDHLKVLFRGVSVPSFNKTLTSKIAIIVIATKRRSRWRPAGAD